MRLAHSVVLLIGAHLLLACSSTESRSGGSASNDCSGVSCQSSAGADSRGDYVLVVDGGAGGSPELAGSDASAEVKACGVDALGCNPDDASACRDIGAGSSGGASFGGATGLGTLGAAGAAALPSDGGAGGGSERGLACRITLADAVARAQCVEAGVAGEGEACSRGADCAPGYGCVNDNGGAVCRHYCCGGRAACSETAYCGERELLEPSASSTGFKAMVCLPAVDCRFDEPFPCPADQLCSCPTGTTCGVVREDGMTACVTPGTGLEGESCPCAAGHVCSLATKTCMKTCNLEHETDNAVECVEGICQDSPSLPIGVGLCVTTAVLG